MSKKIFILFIFLLFISCGRDYIDQEESVVEVQDKITVTSTYSSIDFANIGLSYNDYNFSLIQVRRDTVEIPPTVYDGDFVLLDQLYITNFTDSALTTDQTYYYSIFYLDSNDDWIQNSSFELSSLSYEDGLEQSLVEQITYAKSLNELFDVMISGDYLDLLISDLSVEDSSLSASLDGVLLTGYSKLSNGDDQTVVTKDANLSDLNTLEEDFPVFVVDYCSIDTTCLINLVNENSNFIGFTRDIETDNFIDNSAGINLDNDRVISTISDVQNFMFIDQPVDDSVSDIDDLYYDLIIINPFSDVSSDSGFLSSSDIVSLKTKPSTSSRLVYAYIDFGYANSNYYYWESEWDSVLPDWIDTAVETDSNYYITKYWRTDWASIINAKILQVYKMGFDGIVFGGVDAYKSYPVATD